MGDTGPVSVPHSRRSGRPGEARDSSVSVVPPASAPHPRPPGRVGDRSPLWWPAAVASGILACLAGAVAAACAALALCGLAFAVRRSARTLAVVALLAAAGAVSAAGRLTASNSEVLPHLARARADVVLESVVVSDPEPTRYGWKTLLSVRSVGTDTGKWTVRERVVLFESSRGVGLEPGDRVWVRGKLKTPLELGPAERLAGRPATALSGEEVVRVGKASNPMMAWANRVHSTAAILAGQALPREEAALVRGVAFGDTSGISEETVEDFRASGLSHLLAVSGQNLGVFLAVVLPLAALLGLGPRGRAAAGLTAVAFFVALTRWEPSVLRAAAMGAVGLAALAAGRTRDTVRALGLGGVVLLLADPGLEFSRGFQLSFAATMGIVFVSPRVLARVPARCPRILAQALAVSLGAQIAVAPVLMLTNGTFGLAGIPANVIGLPLAGPAMLLGVTGAFAGVAWAPLGRMLFALDRPVLDALLGLAHTFARAPGARVPAQGWWAVALPAVFALVCLRS
ncbi:MAG: ComEC/Rec2 family competence protein, partial [Actinomycetota bacterium]